MILFLALLYILVIAAYILLWFLHERVEKLSNNQAIMFGSITTLRDNQEIIMNDLKKVIYEIKEFEKESRRK